MGDILSAYIYKIAYKPTKQHSNADWLSRLPQEIDIKYDFYTLSQ